MIYVSSACISEKKIDAIIEQYARNGIKNIELSGGTRYYRGMEENLMLLKKRYNLNYSVHAYFPPPREDFVINLAACNDDVYYKSINHYNKCIELLCKLDVGVLSIHAGFLTEISAHEIGHRINGKIVYDFEKAYDRFCKAFNDIEVRCKENGIVLFLENNVLSLENFQNWGEKNYMMMTDYDSIQRIKKRIQYNLLLDLAHLYVSANTLHLDYDNQCAELSSEAKWIHLSHNNQIRDQHFPLVENSQIMRAYEKYIDKSINVTLETKGSIDDIKKSISILEKIGVER